MNIPASIRTQADRADLARARILEAAVQEFGSHGLAGARTERIAEAANVNKALLYYYFRGKDALYTAALESVFQGVWDSSLALFQGSASAGERFVRIVLTNFDRAFFNPALQALIQQEMVRLHQGEESRLAPFAEKFFRPIWLKAEELIAEGMVAGELIVTDPSQMRYAALGANVFYYLSAPITRLAMGIDPLSPPELERRRKAAVQYLGQTIFSDREHGARVAEQVLASTPMPRRSAAQPPADAPCGLAVPTIPSLPSADPIREDGTHKKQ